MFRVRSFCILILIFLRPNVATKPSAEARLIEEIFSGYDTAVRPVLNSSDTVNVSIIPWLVSLEDMDMRQHRLVSNIWITFQWTDQFLKWEPNDHGGIESIAVPAVRIWKPDIIVREEIHDRGNTITRQNAILAHTGEVTMVVVKQLRTTCKLNIRFFPFDTQECNITFECWTQKAKQLRLFSPARKDSEANLLSEFQEGLFHIYHIELVQIENEAWDFVHVVLWLGIARRPLSYVYTVLWPCALISALTLVTFRLSAESGEKIALGVTMLLVYHVLLSSVGEKMPESSDTVPLVAVFLGIIMTLAGLSIFVSVFVLNIHSQGNRVQVPSWVRSLVFDKLAVLLRIKQAQRFSSLARKQRQAMARSVSSMGKIAMLGTKNRSIRHERTFEEPGTAEEWKMVAIVIDRLFFYVFLVLFLSIIFALLFVVVYHMRKSRY